MAAPKKPQVRVFNETETMTDETAEAEELATGGEPGSTQQSPLEPSAEAAEAPQPPDSTQPPSTQIEQGRIPYERFKKVFDENIELRERWARLDERRRQVDEARQAAETQARQQQIAAQRPDPGVDPVGAELWDTKQTLQQLMQRDQQRELQFQQFQGNFQQSQQQNDFYNWINYEAQNYSREKPDYYDAARFAAERRMEWWQDLGLPPENARQMVLNESNLLAAIARQTGKSFAPVVYKIATQWGYRGANGNGVARPAAEISAAGRTLQQAAAGQRVQGLGRVPTAGAEARSRYSMMTAAELGAVPDNVWQRDWSQGGALRDEMQRALRRLDGLSDDSDVQYFSGR